MPWIKDNGIDFIAALPSPEPYSIQLAELIDWELVFFYQVWQLKFRDYPGIINPAWIDYHRRQKRSARKLPRQFPYGANNLGYKSQHPEDGYYQFGWLREERTIRQLRRWDEDDWIWLKRAAEYNCLKITPWEGRHPVKKSLRELKEQDDREEAYGCRSKFVCKSRWKLPDEYIWRARWDEVKEKGELVNYTNEECAYEMYLVKHGARFHAGYKKEYLAYRKKHGKSEVSALEAFRPENAS
jgi:hypothetical protein